MKTVETLYPPEEWGKIKSSAQDGKIKGCIETKVDRKDNSPVDVDLSINVLKDGDGKILGFTHIINDITKRKHAEQELEKNHELLTLLKDAIPDSIYFKDEQNKYVLINKSSDWKKFLEQIKNKS